MNLPADVLQRVLFINPVIGQSVDRVYELAALYGEISIAAARRLVAILRDADSGPHKTARPERAPPAHGADMARRGLSARVESPSASSRDRANPGNLKTPARG
jgi:hypothetical protein